jgi:hypothetical protein
MYYALVSAALLLTLMPSCCKRPLKPKVPKTSDGCYAWSHYGGGCEKCKANWNECKCSSSMAAPAPPKVEETGCEACMRFISECECAQRDAQSEY